MITTGRILTKLDQGTLISNNDGRFELLNDADDDGRENLLSPE